MNVASHSNTNPPPPYAIFTPLMAQQMVQQMVAYPNVRVGVNDYGDNNGDDDALFSAINISISSPFNIKGNDNLVSLDPHQAASAMGQSIMSSIKAASMAACGIPMIDENGIPRPLKITVDATLMIEGSGNTVGEKSLFHGAQQPDGDHHHRREKRGREEVTTTRGDCERNGAALAVKVESDIDSVKLEIGDYGDAEKDMNDGIKRRRV